MAKVNWINGGIEPMDAERCYVIAEALTDYGALKLGRRCETMDKISRELVAKVWRGEWKYSYTTKVDHFAVVKCSRCDYEAFAMSLTVSEGNFCPYCGAAMTDEAVNLTMWRLEALQEALQDAYAGNADKRYKCRYADDNGVCDKFTETEEIVYCTGRPCLYYTPVEVRDDGAHIEP